MQRGFNFQERQRAERDQRDPLCRSNNITAAECMQADNDFLSDYVQSESLRVRGPLWSHPDGFGGLASIFHYYVDYRSDSAVQDLAGCLAASKRNQEHSKESGGVGGGAVEVETDKGVGNPFCSLAFS
uniref:Uncharacterized protein n=1 Tax=Sphaerodactylus townsendi TaxID=933632 RepID=A0ACB8FDH3_9SAUR